MKKPTRSPCVRALIADPDWVNKAREARVDEIRACTGCNQGCYGNLTQGYPITCVTNPSVGREATLGSGTLTPRRDAASGSSWSAAVRPGWRRRGSRRAGGTTSRSWNDPTCSEARSASRPCFPAAASSSAFADWRADECSRRGVDVRTGVDADRAAVLALGPDAVIVATGGHASVSTPSKSHPMPIAGSEQPWVIDHERALLDADAIGPRVVILDAIGHIEAIGIGHLLAERGREVTVVTPLHSPLLLDAETMQKALPRAVRAGVRWRPNTAVVAIGDHEVTVADVMSYAIDTLPADHVVIRTHGVANDQLYRELQGEVEEVVRVGDAVVPRPADRAIFDGHMAARAL